MVQDKLREQGERLRQFRKAKGLKLREIAEKIEIAVSAVGRWETGKQAIPVSRLKNICAEFGLNRTWLETGKGDMFVKAETFKDQMKAMFNELSPENQAIWLECAAEIVKAGSDTKNGGGNAVRKLYELLKVKHDRKTKSSGVNATIIGDGNEQNIRVQK